MIFVTVGTHEQQFNRLVKCIDLLKKDEIIKEEVIIQTGYSSYIPQYCKWDKLFSYEQMKNYTAEARIVITHGGPASFMMPLQIGKIPIVVPRQYQYKEHVNDHQVDFTRKVADDLGILIPVYDIDDLGNTIVKYDSLILNKNTNIKSNNDKFNHSLECIVNELFPSSL